MKACRNGHPYTPGSYVIYDGARRCKECTRNRYMRRDSKLKKGKRKYVRQEDRRKATAKPRTKSGSGVIAGPITIGSGSVWGTRGGPW